MRKQDTRREEFNNRRGKCCQPVRDVLDFLMTVAASAGDMVDIPSIDGTNGTGISYLKAGKRFCRFDPKFDHRAEHVFACIPGASRTDLKRAGIPPHPARKDDGWVKVANMTGAVRLVPLILRKYDEL